MILLALHSFMFDDNEWAKRLNKHSMPFSIKFDLFTYLTLGRISLTYYGAFQSTARKKMAAAHLITCIIPCEPNTDIRTPRQPRFCGTCPCTNNIVHAGFEVFRVFLCVFMTFLGFSLARIYRLMYLSPTFSLRWIMAIYAWFPPSCSGCHDAREDHHLDFFMLMENCS